MFFKLRKFLVIFLALLQLVAPLVHAHTGQENPAFPGRISGKLHIPGLETYSIEQVALTLKPASLLYDYGVEGIVIGIDVGIRQKQAKLISDATKHYFIEQNTSVGNPAISPFDINFPPPLLPYVCRQLNTSGSPRAPPPAQ